MLKNPNHTKEELSYEVEHGLKEIHNIDMKKETIQRNYLGKYPNF